MNELLKKMFPYNSDELDKELDKFYDLLLEIFERKTIFEEIESLAKGNVSATDQFMRFYAYDYLRLQLMDLRKFFDLGNKVYSIKTIKRYIKSENNKSHKLHNELFESWKNNFKDFADKMFFHMEREYIPEKTGIVRKDLDSFIDQMKELLDCLVTDLTKDGYSVSCLMVEKDDQYQNQTRRDVRDFFDKVSKI